MLVINYYYKLNKKIRNIGKEFNLEIKEIQKKKDLHYINYLQLYLYLYNYTYNILINTLY